MCILSLSLYFKQPNIIGPVLKANYFLLFSVSNFIRILSFWEKCSVQNSFCSIRPYTFSFLPLPTTCNGSFEATVCGWFPWYKTTTFTKRVLQPELIGHDVFQCYVYKHRCPHIAGILAADHACQKREAFSLIIWVTSVVEEDSGHQYRGLVHLSHTVPNSLNCFCFSYWQDQEEQAYFAVFDGHGGVDAAIYASIHLHVNLVRQEMFPHDPAEALCRAFRVTDERFVQKAAREVCLFLINSSHECTGWAQLGLWFKGYFGFCLFWAGII